MGDVERHLSRIGSFIFAPVFGLRLLRATSNIRADPWQMIFESCSCVAMRLGDKCSVHLCLPSAPLRDSAVEVGENHLASTYRSR